MTEPTRLDKAKAYQKARADSAAARAALAADIPDGSATIVITDSGQVVIAKANGMACEDLNPEILDVRTAHS